MGTKMKSKFIIGFSCILIGFCLGFFLKSKDVKIVKETKTEFKYLKTPTTCEGFKECYDSKLGIEVKERGQWIDIVASDSCKEAKKSILVRPVQNRNLIFYNTNFQDHQILYYRRFGNILVGGGVSYPLKAHVGVGYSF